MQPTGSRSLGVFSLTMLSVSAIIALRNLPLMAVKGLSSVSFYAAAAFLFFIPIALACAELASAFPEEGGIYAWVKRAFGQRAAALAIWLEWTESVVWLPTVLSFIAATAAYAINPALAENRFFLLGVMWSVLWAGTFLNFLKLETSSMVSTIGIIFGSLIPGTLIISLGLGWFFAGYPVQTPLTMSALIPSFDFDNLVFFTGILLGLAGIEVAAFHIRETQNPQVTFPKATFLAASLIITIYIFGSLAISFVVPAQEISLAGGLMQAFEAFFNAFNVPWATRILAVLSVIGALALLNTWIIGPSKGLLTSAKMGDWPKPLACANKNGMPVNILLAQAVVGTLLTGFYLLMPTINAIYWFLTVMASQLILLMYAMIFLSVIRLRQTEPNQPRIYKIPGGKLGLYLIAGTGAAACIGAFFLGFAEPKDFDFGDINYAGTLCISLLIFSLPPLLYKKR